MLITGLQQANHVPAFNTIWHISAPSNVKAFVWRVLWGRIQTRVDLSRIGLYFVGDDLKCPLCQLEDESVDHLLFCCVHASTLWYKCYKWMGLVTVLPGECSSHLFQHACEPWNKKQRTAWWDVWCAVVWSVWGWRNKVVFCNEAPDWSNALDIIQWKSWKWISALEKDFQCSIFKWISDPSSCLSQIGH
ncbi:uncharacterized protein LOC130744377 [Lotus japonicus]|uniref:uncharacterized protein LOC130744377 n=1 Tax=Lotus japonicus TaxID=34305 RepID=UPI00258381D8|nr:uncharacterized protein LOC130744377 [Lotus japonicus]